MGISRSCFGYPSPERSPEDQRSNLREPNNAATRLSLTSSIMQCMKVSCLWTRDEATKESSRPREMIINKQQQQQQQQQQRIRASHRDKAIIKEATLGECLLSSPTPGSSYNANGDHDHDQFYVLRPSPFKRVHPALAVNYYACNNPSGRYSTERLLMIRDDEVVDDSEAEFSCLSRSQSGMKKKRVSFKLPEEADIFVYNVQDDGIDGE